MSNLIDRAIELVSKHDFCWPPLDESLALYAEKIGTGRYWNIRLGTLAKRLKGDERAEVLKLISDMAGE